MDETPAPTRYKIGEAASLLGLKPYVLRFWEGEFEELRPIRTESGQRLYTDGHLETIRVIKRLLYEEGLTIDGARRRLSGRDQDTVLGMVLAELQAIKRLLRD